MRRASLGLGVLAWLLSTPGSGPAQDAKPADRARVEAEARGQAAEADRLFKAGAFAEALPLYRAERASRAALGDRRYEAYAARAVGCCLEALGDLDAAVAAWREAAALDARRDDPGFEGYDWLLIGSADLRRGRPTEAAEALAKALPRLGRAVDRDHEADARLAMARALAALGRPSEAAPHADRAADLADALDDPARRALAWQTAGAVALAAGSPGLAAERFADARLAWRALGRRAGAAESDRALGEALADLDRLDEAAAALDDAAKAHDALDDRQALADDRELLAAVLADSGQLPRAAALARLVADARRDLDDVPGRVEALVAQSHYLGQHGDWPAAAAALADALADARPEGAVPPSRLVRLLILAAEVERRAGRPKAAGPLLDEADAVARRADNAALKRLVAEARAGAAAPRRP